MKAKEVFCGESFLLGLSFVVLCKGSQASILIKVHVSVNAIPIVVVMNLERNLWPNFDLKREKNMYLLMFIFEPVVPIGLCPR